MLAGRFLWLCWQQYSGQEGYKDGDTQVNWPWQNECYGDAACHGRWYQKTANDRIQRQRLYQRRQDLEAEIVYYCQVSPKIPFASIRMWFLLLKSGGAASIAVRPKHEILRYFYNQM